MNIAEIKSDIRDLEAAIKSPQTPDNFKQKMMAQVEVLQGKLAEAEAKAKAPAPAPSTEPKKKGVPLPKEKQKQVVYDCDELIAKAKERRKAAKERAAGPQKSPATKNKEKIETVFDNVKKRADEKDISKAEIEKLISETKALLKLLESKLSSL
jgi:primosomal protein N''